MRKNKPDIAMVSKLVSLRHISSIICPEYLREIWKFVNPNRLRLLLRWNKDTSISSPAYQLTFPFKILRTFNKTISFKSSVVLPSILKFRLDNSLIIPDSTLRVYVCMCIYENIEMSNFLFCILRLVLIHFLSINYQWKMETLLVSD